MVGDYLKARLVLTAAAAAVLAVAVPMARAAGYVAMGYAEPTGVVMETAHHNSDGARSRPVLAVRATARSW